MVATGSAPGLELRFGSPSGHIVDYQNIYPPAASFTSGGKLSNYAITGNLDYVAQVAPTAGAFTAPTQNQLINTTSVTFSGTTPHGNGDGAYDYTAEVQLQVFEAGTNVKVYDQAATTTPTEQSNRNFSRVVANLTAGKSYYARYRHKDSWGAWSPFSTDRAFTMAQGPDAPTPVAPLILVNQITPPVYRFEHNHPEGRAANSYEIELRNSSGTTVLWNSGKTTFGTALTSGSTSNVNSANFGNHPTLAWGASYQWRARVWDSLDAAGPYSTLSAGAFKANSTPAAPTNLQPAANSKTGNRLVGVSVSDPDGDAITGVELDLVRVSTGAMVTGYPKQMTIQSATFADFEIPQADVIAGVQYRYRVRATDGKASGYGPYSGYTTFTYVVAAAVSLLTPAERTNRIPDPSFEYETSYWQVIGAAGGSTAVREQTEDSAYGSWRMRLTKAAGTELTDLEIRGGARTIDATKNYRLRGAAKKVLPESGTNTPTNATFGLRCLSASGAFLGYVLPHGILSMDARNLDPYWRSYGGLIRPVGTTGSTHPAFLANTTQVEPFVFLSGAAQDVAVDAFMLEEVPNVADADWTRLSGLYGYIDPDLPADSPGGYASSGAYGGTVGSWSGDPGNSESRVLSLLDKADNNSVAISYSHPSSIAKVSDRLVIERLKPNGTWERHHESLWRTTASLVLPVPDYLFRNQRRYRAYVEVKDANDITARTGYAEFPTRYQGPPELPVVSYSADPKSATVTINFEATGLGTDFGGIEVARECEETGEDLRTVALITDPSATSYTYHFPVSQRVYRYHVRQIQLVGPERIEGRYRSVEASVDYEGYDFIKLARDPSVFVAFEHLIDEGPAFPRTAPVEGYQPWGALAPVHLFGEGRMRSGTTTFELYNDPSLPEPRERLKTLKKMELERGALCLLTQLPEPEKTFIALSGDVVFTNQARLINVSLPWAQTAYSENVYDVLGSYEEETA